METCGRCYDEVKQVFPAPCNEKPELLANAPIGMYHCPDCGAMLLAGLKHPPLCQECLDRKKPGMDIPYQIEKENDSMPNDWPRRRSMDKWTPAELAIHNAIQEVEKEGADVRLTNSVILLNEAQECVADFVDNQEHLDTVKRLGMAMDLLKRASDPLSENPPDKDWFREYLTLTGEHVILTDEGWMPGSEKATVIREYGEKAVLDELNAPK